MSFTVTVAADLTAAQLEGYIRPKNARDVLQRVADKPLLRHLEASKLEYGAAGYAQGSTPDSSTQNLREGVMGALMKDQSGFYVGIAGDDVLAFKSSDGAVQTTCPIRWMHGGWQITHEELLAAGVHVVKEKVTSTPDDRTKLLDLLETRKADYTESVDYSRNMTLWLDGTQDSKAIPGIKSILTDDPTTGTTLGISRANIWWRHVADTGVGGANPKLVYSKADQTLTERLISVLAYELTVYGGKPNVCLAGRDICDAVTREARAKGQLTVTGWADKKTNIQVKGVKVGDLEIEHDPTLDLIGESKRIYIWDSNRLKLRPQKMEWGKVTAQNQPSDQFVMLTSTTDKGVLTCRQLDCCYVGEMV
jgi:hypothetical protein